MRRKQVHTLSRHSSPYIVLVTGGAGFLGQHIVGLLQSRADHVTEIRVLDMIPYRNKLQDYEAQKPVHDFTGSINDEELVNRACANVDCVMHVASFVDTSLMPDSEFSTRINVEGTRNIINACRKHGVRRLVYCSTVEVVTDKNSSIWNGTEDTLSYQEHYLFEAYGQTKKEAEKLVLQANSGVLQTISLRPAVMYGELEWRLYGVICSSILARKLGLYVALDCQKGVAEHVYVGNVAWAFICADHKLRDTENNTDASGCSFFITDDSPRKSVFEFLQPIMEDIGVRPFPLKLPLWMVLFPLYIIYFILSVVGICCRVNLSVGIESFVSLKRVALFRYNKAKDKLNYVPLFSYNEAKSRTAVYFQKLLK